ncbi:hypothetical protein [Streptomyces sp. AC550_RSS872]|uniref:hypothetical protein n=1 Tax=Streptomyces sp. AC550_RSS872 TaxID=2823689 RepID=UPI001C265825|nr:hypothetical protein [Streptomyces sp. AC550_RSS872]
MSGAADERGRIRIAMDRILTGRPERSSGTLTIVARFGSANRSYGSRNSARRTRPSSNNSKPMLRGWAVF